MPKANFITRTAILLALTLVFQMLRQFIPMSNILSIFIVGTLVNACLAVSAKMVGLWGGLIISIVAPIVAFLQGHLKFIWMIPVVAIGNAILVAAFALFKSDYFALIIGALTKFVFLFLSVTLLLRYIKIPAAAAKLMSFSFSWPQLVTALLGGIIALAVWNLVKKSYR